MGAMVFTGTAWYEKQPDGVVYIGKSAYSYKGKAPSDVGVTLKAGTKIIANGAFNYSKLKSVTIPNSVTNIGYEAFLCCDKLTAVTIPNSVKSIGNYAFMYCGGLESIIIPNNVTSIGDNTFLFCPKLTIYGNAGSYAETYAKAHNIPFGLTSSAPRSFTLGDIDGNGKIQIADAMEIFKNLAGMKNKIKTDGKNSGAWNAALITSASQKSGKPAIGDALEILKKLAGMKNLLPNKAALTNSLNLYNDGEGKPSPSVCMAVNIKKLSIIRYAFITPKQVQTGCYTIRRRTRFDSAVRRDCRFPQYRRASLQVLNRRS
jgi:hypothetical protein